MRQTRGSEKSCLMVALWASLVSLVLFALCLVTTPAIAEGPQQTRQAREVEGGSGARAAEPEFSVPTTTPKNRPKGESPGFDALLRLPSGFVTTKPHAVAGAGESEWRRRFEKADSDLTEARLSLERTKRELDGVAGGGGSSQWAITPPGGGGNAGESGPTNSPLSFKLRQQLRGDRDRITVTERAMRELRIEADLAGVPQSWRTATSDSAEIRQELD